MAENNNTLVLQLTKDELIEVIREAVGLNSIEEECSGNKKVKKNLVYGLQGIADLLGASKSTVSRIKATGVLDPALSQRGKTIVCDADLALSLLRINNNRQAIRGKMQHRQTLK